MVLHLPESRRRTLPRTLAGPLLAGVLMKKLFALCVLLVTVSTVPADAAVIIVFDDSSPQTTTGLTGSATSGDMMDGMTVTAGFSAGGTDVQTWADSAIVGCGSATGAGWSLSQCADTFAGPWTLSSTAGLTSLFIDAGTGDAVFDTTFGVAFGTDGSFLGRDFTTVSTVDITATYSGPVGVGSDPPVGDLYRFLRLDFTG